MTQIQRKSHHTKYNDIHAYIVEIGYNWKTPHNSRASDIMCPIYEMKGY